MKKIFKYKLETRDTQEIEMPIDSQILCVQTQDGVLCLWALVDPDNEKQKRRIIIIGTGHPIPTLNLKYIGTAQQLNGFLMWHVFEEERNE